MSIQRLPISTIGGGNLSGVEGSSMLECAESLLTACLDSRVAIAIFRERRVSLKTRFSGVKCQLEPRGGNNRQIQTRHLACVSLHQ